jgi:precorrin-4/cobalt-precorrin-4 C11-methyltransferase
MTVHFIGAGPGAADLITLRGRDLIARCPVCLFAGSIVPRELLAHCPADARIVDTAPMTLDQIEAEFLTAHAAGLDVARLHSGDLSIYSALAEQLRRLARHGIPYSLVPGVPAFAAAAATLAIHLAITSIDRIVSELTPFYGAECPAVVVARASWPDQRIIRGTLADIAQRLAAEPIERTALVLVGRALAATDFRDSALYDPGYHRRFRAGAPPS